MEIGNEFMRLLSPYYTYVDYDHFERMLGAGRYACLDENINEQNFPAPKSGKFKKCLSVWELKQDMSSASIITKMREWNSDLRLAGLYELLAFGAMGLNLEHWLVALGSIWGNAINELFVPYISSGWSSSSYPTYAAALSLSEFSQDKIWKKENRFLSMFGE